ncbi:hypothetical protein GCM10023168_20970 [Fodinibacter luteus]|uniref:Polyketide cyclase n=1 Tax=Fodinibacter luteus TaxID=552064 RepID=A0ABP8KGD0_9MICO
MVKFHIVDEALLQATPEEVEQAFADEAAGRSSWWAPKVQVRTRDGRLPHEVGTITDYRVATVGRADRPGAAWFATRVTRSEPGRVETEYFDGAFRGRAVLTTERVADGRTCIRNDWQTETHGLLMGILARLLNIGAGHSRVMREGFAGMERDIARKRATSSA